MRVSWVAAWAGAVWIAACGSRFQRTGADAGTTDGGVHDHRDASTTGSGGTAGAGGTRVASSGGAMSIAGTGGHTPPGRDAAIGPNGADATASDAHGDAPVDAARGESRYRRTILADAPRVYWRMNIRTGRTVPDESGGSNDLILQGTGHQLGAAGALTGEDDRAIEFDGTASFAIATNPRPLDFAGGAPFTLECWARRKSGGASYFQHLISNLEGNPNDRNGYLLYLLPEPGGQDNARTVFEYDRPANDFGLWGSLPVESKWTHVAAVFDGSKAVLYVDGTLADSGAAGGGFAARTGPFAVARASQSDGSYFRGALDEIAVYPRALAAADIARHIAAAQ